MGFDPTFDEVAANPRPVGIECDQCLRRVLFEARTVLKPRKGDKRRMSEVRLHCARCGSRAFTAQLFQTHAEATTFMKGYR
jgi:hypothetical protein